mgnify:CR=1 FL=1
MDQVALARLGNQSIFEAVSQVVDLVGGIDKYVKKGDLVLIKPNSFILARPETGFITHPEVVLAIAKLCHKRGARVVVGERRRNIFTNFQDYPEINDYAELISFDEAPLKLKTIPGAKALYMSIAIPRIVDECDVFINVPGLRTHALTDMSNGLKNVMGILPDNSTRLVHDLGLTDSIVDLNLARPSDLIVSDAIYSVQGNFPAGGEMIQTNFLMASTNMVAIDVVAATIMGFDPSAVEHINEAAARGLGPATLDEIKVVGSSLDSVRFTPQRADHDYGKYKDRLDITDGAACKGCRQSLASAIAAAAAEIGEEQIRDLRIITGPVETLPAGPRDRVLMYGSCTRRFKDQGTFIPGCPPLAGQGKKFIVKLCGKRKEME